MYMLNGQWFLSSGGSYPSVFTVYAWPKHQSLSFPISSQIPYT